MTSPLPPERIPASVVIEAVLTDRTWRARLPNGKEILAFARPRHPQRTLHVGDQVQVWMTVEDFSRGEVQ